MVMFEFGVDAKHTYESIEIMTHFTQYYVNEARKSTHRFNDTDEESHKIFYNYDAVYNNSNQFKQYYWMTYEELMN